MYSTRSFEKRFGYTGEDLGAVWTADGTAFRLWAPTAAAVSVKLYAGGDPMRDDLIGRLPMTPDVQGTWTARKAGDLNGVYYTFEVTIDGETLEAGDPYARAAGVNGVRSMVIDLGATDPEGWDGDKNPNAVRSYTDAVIYELHLRDISSDKSSGIRDAGKFLGLAQSGTRTPGGVPTGLDHIKELGVTHVHLLPSFDYGSVDESRPDKPQYNWGYDPVNYNVPEGSYATDPFDGAVRVREMKRMVRTLHENGLGVVLDVVYNHVYEADTFCFNKIVPGYFSRIDRRGRYSNGSQCGNDTASERFMVRKYIVDSVKYWAEEYHVDGFRFDLAGLIDTGTVNEVVEKVHSARPDVLFYGEGWTMPTRPTKRGVKMATQLNCAMTPGFAYFSDTMRDALKGRFSDLKPGFVSGDVSFAETVKNCFLGRPGWSENPAQIVNYASCHDNHTLFDRIALSVPDASLEDMIRMNNLAAAIYMTARGIPFLHSGEELLRSKKDKYGNIVENSYNSPDGVNSIKWSDLEKDEYRRVFEYYKGLIAFRKAHAALRAPDTAGIRAMEGLPEGVIAFETQGPERIILIFNSAKSPYTAALPEGVWDVYISGGSAGTEVLDTVTEGSVTVGPISAEVLVREAAK